MVVSRLAYLVNQVCKMKGKIFSISETPLNELDYPPLVPCNTTEDVQCACEYNFMVTIYKGSNFCMFMYFNPSGDMSSFPVCDDYPGCQTTCSKSI